MYTDKKTYEFISTQNSDPIVERKTCAISGTQFPIFKSDLDFYKRMSPSFGGVKFEIPTPKLCPEERQRRRLSFMNQSKLYKNKCNSCKRSIVARFHPQSGIGVFCNECWTIHQENHEQYSIDFDPSKNFTEHLRDLIDHTCFQNLIGSYSNLGANSTYTNYTADITNSYMVFEGDSVENCCYASSIKKCKSCVDCAYGSKSEECYNCVDFSNCFNCKSCTDISDSSYLNYCQDCHNCQFCTGCTGLVGKSYYVNNEPVEKENYNQIIKSYNYNTNPKSAIVKACYNVMGSENCLGNNIFDSKDCIVCFGVFDCQNAKYSYSMNTAQDFMDIDAFGTDSYLMLDCLSAGRYSNNLLFCNSIGRGENLLYCIDVKKSSNCFGCVNLKDSEYCIFNKQYTKDEYEQIVGKIIAHMIQTGERGEFFHPSLSPFGYNETVAQEYYPLSPDVIASEAKQSIGLPRSEFDSISQASLRTTPVGARNDVRREILGYKRSDYLADPKVPEGVSTLSGNQIPDDITQVKDSILDTIIICEISGRPFKYQKMELDFYRKHGVQLPRKHPDIRHEELIKERAGRTLYLRKCDHCNREMLSVYPFGVVGAPGRASVIGNTNLYCEECYKQQIYG